MNEEPAPEPISSGQWYDVEVEINGDMATLKADGQQKATCTFVNGILGGKVGLRVENAHSHFKDAALKSFVQVTRYYFFNGVRVALRKDNRVQYLAGDHLGTTSVVVDGSGTKVGESRHRPYGEVRWPLDGTFPTDYRFTGQPLESGLGLYHMGASWYDPPNPPISRAATHRCRDRDMPA